MDKRCDKLAFSAALSVSIVYSILTLLHVIWPEKTLKFFASVHHLKSIAPLQPEVTITNYVTGLIFSFVIVYLIVWLSGIIYCAITRNRSYYDKDDRNNYQFK